MPKQTFFNLPAEKRNLIIETALEEFAANAFDTASLSRIVEKANIAKGSMYQYFGNKEEFYEYLIGYASERKLSFVNASLTEEGGDFFSLYKKIIFAAARFDFDFPLYSSFLYTAGRDTHNPRLHKQIMDSSAAFIKGLLEKAYLNGQIRKDVNLDFAAFVISYLSVDAGEYIAGKYNYSYISALKSNKGRIPVTDSQLDEVLNELIDFFKRGIAAETNGLPG
jgi:AcrR family transcriptional regulator